MVAFERPPRWGLIALIALVVANIVLVLLLVQRQDADPASSSSATETTRATTSARTTTSAPTTTPATGTSAAAPTTGTPADPGLLAVYGDGYSSGNSEGGVGAAGWPALVATQLGMQLQVSAATLSGYVNVGSTGQTYPQLAQAQPAAGASVTVVFGSRNDVGAAPEQVQAAAAATFAAIQAADPGTDLLVIGPCWTDANPPAELTAVSAATRAAAEAAGGTYVDPLTEGWFADPTGLVSPADTISILDAGHSYPASLIAPLVVTQLDR